MLAAHILSWHTHLAVQTRREAALDARRASYIYADPAQARRLRFKADVLATRCAAQDHRAGRWFDTWQAPSRLPRPATAPPAPNPWRDRAHMAACLVTAAMRQVVDVMACLVGVAVGAARYFLPVDHWDRFRLAAESGALGPLPDAPDVAPRESAGPKFCIVTQYTDKIASYADIAVANHHAYARQHGYEAVAYKGRLSGDAFVSPSRGGLDTLAGGGLYWQKISALEMALARVDAQGRPACDWAMWVDSDIVFTNPHNTLEAVVATYAPVGSDKHVILSREQAGRQDVPINAGAMFVQNSEPGRQFLRDIAQSYERYQWHGLPEQDAITDFAFCQREGSQRQAWTHLQKHIHPQVAIAPQRAFNGFVRSHRLDGVQSCWQPFDFIAHVSYGAAANRVKRMHDVLATVPWCRAAAALPV